MTKRIVCVGSIDDIITLLTSDYPFIQRMSKVTQEQLNSFGKHQHLSDVHSEYIALHLLDIIHSHFENESLKVITE